MEVRRTTKSAILKGNPKFPDLIATSNYDTNPVNYLRMSSDELKWVVYEKDVYNIDTGAKKPLKFLQMCYINAYNHQTGDVEVADQPRKIIGLIIG